MPRSATSKFDPSLGALDNVVKGSGSPEQNFYGKLMCAGKSDREKILDSYHQDELDIEAEVVGAVYYYMPLLYRLIKTRDYESCVRLLEKTSVLKNPNYVASTSGKNYIEMLWDRLSAPLDDIVLDYTRFNLLLELLIMLILRGCRLPPEIIQETRDKPIWEYTYSLDAFFCKWSIVHSYKEIREKAESARKKVKSVLANLISHPNKNGKYDDAIRGLIASEYIGVTDGEVDTAVMGPRHSRIRSDSILLWTDFTRDIAERSRILGYYDSV
jgi:hypothetical protein